METTLLTPIEMSLVNLQEAKNFQINANNIWDGSLHEGMNRLTIDQSGKVGEKTFYQWCASASNIKIDYDENNTDQPDGIYEGSISLVEDEPVLVQVNNPKYRGETENLYRYKKRYEIKTARLGNENSFQHENIKPKEFCDLIVFIDYSPDEIYLTILDTNFDYTQKHPIMGITPHKRKEANGYKMDFRYSQIMKGIDTGVTMRISQGTSLDDVHKFIEKFLK